MTYYNSIYIYRYNGECESLELHHNQQSALASLRGFLGHVIPLPNSARFLAFLLGVWPHFLGNSWSCQWCEVQRALWKYWRQQWPATMTCHPSSVVTCLCTYQAFPPIDHYILCTAQTCRNAVRVTEVSPFLPRWSQDHPIPASSWIAAAPAASFCKQFQRLLFFL